ncbi:MAG: ABC transporter ATP-binding protein [Clostridium sp.]|uniref:ABC transporter ATP-binding protein n=1 Tax=Clostridium sp. TaxID=1506 RepID=UPI00290C6001|nr:ABC transporter ATP-binding protein [Clostridium sp.]MDU7337910.1 ABC transporter ATP-binding protein [Clostridium sp.]
MIEVKSLVKKFGSKAALDGISFTIDAGSVFGLVGSNGAGKSTLLRSLAGIYQPESGEILVDGLQPFENSTVKSKLFFISDYPYFFPQANMKEMADFYSKTYASWDSKRYEELCALFPLDQNARIINMSKGMQRQVALINALSVRPDYLLLDEIFDGLDPVMRQLLKKLVSSEVSERGMSVVIASHNLRELEDLCDHVGLMHKGGVVFEQELDALKLGIHRVQAIFKPMPLQEALQDFDIIKQDIRGSLVNFVIRGKREEILEKLNALNPVFIEMLPLTLEEVFISEMEVAGYDIENILK